jgi:hypothetical protein
VSRLQYAEVVRRLMRDARTEPPPSLPGDRRRLEAAVAGALRARGRRRVAVRRGVGATFAVAAALALAWGGPSLWRRARPGTDDVAGTRAAHELKVLAADEGRGGDAIVGDHTHVPLRGGMKLDAGIRLVAPASGEVRVGTPAGTQLTLEPRADLTVTEASATQRFALHAGAVRARVERLFAGERFVIDTPDAEVEVHGTAFRVAVVEADPRCGAGTRTRVSVSEGIVTVRAGGAESRVTPGREWPTGCGESDAPASSIAAYVPRRPSASASGARREARHPSEAAPVAVEPPAPVAPTPAAKVIEASDLVAQNDLFEAAVRAKKQGQAAVAVRLFTKLVVEHPAGPLVESASVQRMRLLGTLDAAEAARAARDYLARFPGGFARADAEKLAARTEP